MIASLHVKNFQWKNQSRIIMSEYRRLAPRSKIGLVRSGFGPKSGSRTGFASNFISGFTSTEASNTLELFDGVAVDGRDTGTGGLSECLAVGATVEVVVLDGPGREFELAVPGGVQSGSFRIADFNLSLNFRCSAMKFRRSLLNFSSCSIIF